MNALEDIIANLIGELERLIDQKVESKLEKRIPDMVRAVGIRDADTLEHEELMDASEVAKRLGFDMSNENAILLSKQRVYTLARQRLIPSVRLSPRRVRFSRAAVEQVIKDGGLAAASTKAA